MKKIHAAIIDDEEHCHLALGQLLSSYHPDVEVVAKGYSVAEGLDIIAAHKPDLVFLDVEMQDGTGFDLLQKIGKPAFYVVFITAYNKYAEAAFLFGALDFQTKPVISDRLSETMERVRTRLQEKYTLDQLQIALGFYQNAHAQHANHSRICVPTFDGFEIIEVERIIHLASDRNITEFHILDRTKKLLAYKQLKDYEKYFEMHPAFDKFIKRVHRSHIANLLMVEKWVKSESLLMMRDGCQIPVSDTHRDDVVRWLTEL